jgi:hypothetical protein
MMRALSLTQPWATLIAIKAKQIETRSFQRSYRGQLAIHAAKGMKESDYAKCRSSYFLQALQPVFPDVALYSLFAYPPFPRGAIVAVCELIDCVPTANVGCPGGPLATWRHGDHWWLLTDQERAFGDYSAGRWAWLLSSIRALPEPVPAKGALGLWTMDEATESAVMRQLPPHGREG